MVALHINLLFLHQAESVGGSPSPAVPTPDQQQRKDDIVEAALRGRLDFEYPLTSRIVRIFTSSTFTGERRDLSTSEELHCCSRCFPVNGKRHALERLKNECFPTSMCFF